MRPGGGKAKGAAFEREVCVKLSRWVSGGKREDCFWRSAMSGGRATVHARKGNKMHSQVGDISAVDALGHPFCSKIMVECKHVKDLNFQGALIKGSGPLAQFWFTLQVQAEDHGKRPLLIARQNNTPVVFITTPAANARLFRMPATMLLGELSQLGVHVFQFDDFLEFAPYVNSRFV